MSVNHFNAFWWSSELEDFLFYGYNVHTAIGLAVTWFAVFALSFMFEWIKLLQARHRQRQLYMRASQLKAICPTESSTLLNENRETILPLTFMLRVKIFCYEMLLWLSIQNLGYILMLSVMFYNGWLMIAVILGGGVGYFLFGHSLMKVHIQNCEILRETYCMLRGQDPDTCGSCCEGESTPALDHISSNEEPCHEETEAMVTVHT